MQYFFLEWIVPNKIMIRQNFINKFKASKKCQKLHEENQKR